MAVVEVGDSGSDDTVAGPRLPLPGAFVRRHRLLLVLLLVAGVYFFYFYMQNTHRPGAATETGWNGWSDTGAYLKEARAIRAGNLDPSQYAYPMGYPLAAAPFVDLLPKDPFLPVNLASYLAVVGLFFATARRFVGKQLAFVGGLLFVLASPVLAYTSVPWSTTPAILTVSWLAYTVFGRRRVDLLAVTIGGLLLGWTYMARGGGEWVLLAPFGLAVMWQHRRDPGILARAGLLVAILVAFVGLNALWTRAIFDTFQHPYLKTVAKVGFEWDKVPTSLWGTLVYSGRRGDYWAPLGLQGLWLVFAPAGVYIAARRRDAVVHLGMLASIVLGLVVVGAFYAFEAGALKYNCLHYVKLWLPVLALYALIAIRSFIEQPERRSAGHQ